MIYTWSLSEVAFSRVCFRMCVQEFVFECVFSNVCVQEFIFDLTYYYPITEINMLRQFDEII